MANKRNRTISRFRKKYEKLAAAVTTAAVLSGLMLPGFSGAAEAAAPPSYEKELNVTATAYAPGAHDNGPWGDKTFMGTLIRPGVVAVDPKIIPLGSRLYIEYPDGSGQYAVAEDTGGAIKGNRIDIAKTSVRAAYDFGMKQVKVYVLSTPKKAKV